MKPADHKPLDRGVEELAGVHTPYEPPSLDVIGSITEFTFGSSGDSNDMASRTPKPSGNKAALPY